MDKAPLDERTGHNLYPVLLAPTETSLDERADLVKRADKAARDQDPRVFQVQASYVDNLRHVLSSMEGHYIRGTGDGSAKALDSLPFELLDHAEQAAAVMLREQPDTSARMDKVARLIEGFESTYGLELLATVHWAARRDDDGSSRSEVLPLGEVESVVGSWNRRKGRLFTSPHMAKAYERLKQQGWLDPIGSPGLFMTP